MDAINLYTMQLQARLLSALDTSFSAGSTQSDTNSSASFAGILQSFLTARLNGTASASGSQAVSSQAAGTAGDMQISDAGVQFIAEHEGYSATAYRGADVQNRTIGYGHVIESGESFGSLTQTQALNLLKSDLKSCEDSVNREFSGVNMTQSQFDSLVSYAYNLGSNIWDKTPTLTNDIKTGVTGEKLQADFASASYCNGTQLQGLLNRRLDEYALFSSGDYSSANL